VPAESLTAKGRQTRVLAGSFLRDVVAPLGPQLHFPTRQRTRSSSSRR
jgi:hypothetical protein